ncbi:hypothetical protein LR48_Vigan01g091200 [Vigna angularis]|uniref:Uncharacterized protein n=1 Tax=Phaseolus angularis TaxID=3914 RepID=A0A0L9TLL8_PHAAN|nr:hypothetical protein LR48_Vigan01g091200 [Vigna angularis]
MLPTLSYFLSLIASHDCSVIKGSDRSVQPVQALQEILSSWKSQNGGKVASLSYSVAIMSKMFQLGPMLRNRSDAYVSHHSKLENQFASLISDTIVRAKRFLTVLPTHQIEEPALHQMGFVRQGNVYVHAEGGDEKAHEEVDEDDEDIPMSDPTNVAGPSQHQQEYNLESLSRQIEAMASMQQTRIDEMMAYQALRYDKIVNESTSVPNRIK